MENDILQLNQENIMKLDNYDAIRSVISEVGLDPDNISELREKLMAFSQYFANYKTAYEIFEAYESDTELNKRKTTIDRDRVVFDMFLKESNTFSLEELKKFQKRRLKSGLKPQSVNTYMSTLKACCKWAAARDIIPKDFSILLPSIQVGKNVVEEVHFDIKKTLEEVLLDSSVKEFVRYRNASMIIVCAIGGARVEEAVSMKLSNVEIKDGVARVKLEKTKNHAQRWIYLTKNFTEIFRNYIELRKTIGESDQSLFVSQRKRDGSSALTTDGYRTVINDITGLNPHKLRDYCATTLARSGMSLEQVSKHLGNTAKVCENYYVFMGEDEKCKTAQVLDRLLN
jgi:site-specific recombinase XerD